MQILEEESVSDISPKHSFGKNLPKKYEMIFISGELKSGSGNPAGTFQKLLHLRPGNEDFAERLARAEKAAFDQSSDAFCAAIEHCRRFFDGVNQRHQRRSFGSFFNVVHAVFRSSDAELHRLRQLSQKVQKFE